MFKKYGIFGDMSENNKMPILKIKNVNITVLVDSNVFYIIVYIILSLAQLN